MRRAGIFKPYDAVIAFILSTTFFGCSKISSYNEKIKVSIAATSHPYSGLICIADKEGLFEKNGLSVKITYNETSAESIDKLDRAEADFAATSMYALARTLTHPKKPPRILAEIASGTQDFYFVSYLSRNINSPKSLEGKTLGYRATPTTDAMLYGYFSNGGINGKLVKLVPMSNDQLKTSLKNHSVDAILTYDPVLGDVQKDLGATKLRFMNVSLSPLVLVLVTSPISAKADLIVHRKVLQSLMDAEANLDIVSDVTLAELKSCFPKFEAETIHKWVDAIGYHVLASEQMRFAYGQATEWVKRTSTPFELVPPSFDEVYFKTALQQLKPVRVLIQ